MTVHNRLTSSASYRERPRRGRVALAMIGRSRRPFNDSPSARLHTLRHLHTCDRDLAKQVCGYGVGNALYHDSLA